MRQSGVQDLLPKPLGTRLVTGWPPLSEGLESISVLGMGRFQQRKGSWGEGPLVKRLLSKHKGLSSDPRTHIKELDLVACAWNPSNGEAESRGSLGLVG